MMDVPGPFRSQKVLRHARGQPCTLRISPQCDGGGASGTTVACHIRGGHKGAGIKESDHSIAFGCGACHRFLDEGFVRHHMSAEDLAPYEKRGLQETWAILIRDGIIVFPHDLKAPPLSKPTPTRKPPDQRAKIAGRGFPEGPRQKMPSRPFRTKETT